MPFQNYISMPAHFRPYLLSTIVVPAASALCLGLYLKGHPLSSKRSQKIIPTETISPSCEASSSFRIVNPGNHIAMKDSYSIYLLKTEIKGLSDEEILARFLKGFFAGWIFTPERYLFAFLSVFGLKFVPVGFTGIETQDPGLASPLKLSSTSLPPMHSILFRGNFMLLDKNVLPEAKEKQESLDQLCTSFVDVGYGDNRKGFAGIHRFELTRDPEHKGSGATICYSSISCNPTVNKPVLPHFIYIFHKFYARNLFRDGIAGVFAGESKNSEAFEL